MADNNGPIFADSFEIGLAPWSGVIGSAEVITQSVMGPHGGALGMAATIGPEQQPAYVYDTSPNAETMYAANFYFNPNKTTSNSPIDIFIGLDQNGQPIFGVQYQSDSLNTFQLRAWVLQNGEPVYTRWDVFTTDPENEDEITNSIHKIDVAWLSGSSAGFSLYIDDNLLATLIGDTSASQLDEVLLGPSLGLTTSAAGTMYFDEFTSSKLNGVLYTLSLPVISR
jgi:hypothetical protein